MTKKITVVQRVKNIVLMGIGSVIAAAGLDVFLVPNNIIDGGVVGISIMASYLTGWSLSAFLVLLNLPFLYLGYTQIGKTFAFSTLFSIISLAFWVGVFTPIPEVTNDLFLAAVFGGITIGVGIGIIIRHGGCTDGTEMIAILMDKRTSFSIGEIIMFFNLFILTAAGFVFSWDKAMYSLVTYFVAFKVIDITLRGLDESKAVYIISDQMEEIRDALMARLGRGVTILHATGGYSKEEKPVLYCVVTRLEVAKLKSIVSEWDETAFVTISDVHEVMGGRFKKKAIH